MAQFFLIQFCERELRRMVRKNGPIREKENLLEEKKVVKAHSI